jgi:hypothetical protein
MKALDAAIELGARGIPCFPCTWNKRPTCPGGFHSAQTDAGALRELWRKHPGPLVGVPTGPASGIDVLDVDRKHPEAVEWWRANKPLIPETRMHRTRSGGLHALFKSHDGLRCSTGKIAPGVDVRGMGGYIIHWPSAGFPVVDAPIAPWPPWLLELLIERPKPQPRVKLTASGDIAPLVRFVLRTTEGDRNRSVFWAACRAGEMVARGLINSNYAEAMLVEAASRTGISVAEARRTVVSGMQQTLGAPVR